MAALLLFLALLGDPAADPRRSAVPAGETPVPAVVSPAGTPRLVVSTARAPAPERTGSRHAQADARAAGALGAIAIVAGAAVVVYFFIVGMALSALG